MDEDGGLGVAEHHTSLRERVAHFLAKGEVVIVGDQDARSGGQADRAEVTDLNIAREPGAMGAAGVTAADATPSHWCAGVPGIWGHGYQQQTWYLLTGHVPGAGAPYPQWTPARG